MSTAWLIALVGGVGAFMLGLAVTLGRFDPADDDDMFGAPENPFRLEGVRDGCDAC